MKRAAKPLNRQMNLPLLDAPAIAGGEQQKQLTLALVELLVQAAQESLESQLPGGTNESLEAHA